LSDTLDLTGLVEKRRGKKLWYEDCDSSVIAKRCSMCLNTKGIDSFTKLNKGLGGREPRCKQCRALIREEYYKNNRDSILERRKIHRELNYNSVVERERKNRIKNREARLNYSKQWAENNKERVKRNRRRYYESNKDRCISLSRKWNEDNKARCAEIHKKWKENNPEKRKLYRHIRRARKAELPNDFTSEQQSEVLTYFENRCALTGSQDKYAWDHAIPIASGHGGTTYGNMYPLRGDLNSSKGDRNIFEWFKANRQRFNLSQAKFDALIDWLAETNDMTVEEYTSYVYECHGDELKEA
jgi:hypothetical protein